MLTRAYTRGSDMFILFEYLNGNADGVNVLVKLFNFFWDLIINKTLFSWNFWMIAIIGIILYFIIVVAGRPPEYKYARYG
jgi:hypothetical protein